MTVPVDIYLRDRSVVSVPIKGAVVSIVDPQSFQTVATALTDVTGRAAFLLPGSTLGLGTAYEVRFFKLGVIFPNPQKIYVQEPAVTTNKFDMTGTLLQLPAATDPRVCRCTGRFMSLSNTPIVGATVRVMANAGTGLQAPKVVDGNLVSAEVLATKTDGDGFVSIDLIRRGEYYITFSGDDDTVWRIKVPDLPSANLVELVHPAPKLFKWDSVVAPSAQLTVAVGATINVPFSIIFSDYEEVTVGACKWISFTFDDTYATVGYNDSGVCITAVAPGTFPIQPQLLPDLLPIRMPHYYLVAPALNVTVIP